MDSTFKFSVAFVTLIFIIFSLFSVKVFAAGGSGTVTINNIHQRECTGDKDFEIILSTPHSNPDSCSNNNIVNLACNHAAFPQMTSLAISAMIADKTVVLWLNGCDAQGQAKVGTIQVNK